MLAEILKETESRMHKSVQSLEKELSKIRTGRAHPSLLEHITLDYYGSEVPISQVANVNVEDARTLIVTPWEKQMVQAVEKAIMISDLGLNPATSGAVIRVPMPALTEQRRKELTKVARHETENGRVAVRNIRRDAIQDFKELLKDKEISEDEERKAQDQVQKLTDRFVAQMDAILETKEKDLMEI
jgi:ribosome recycling factor